MPFQSRAQEKFMYAKHPDIAKRWQKEAPVSFSSLPVHKKPKAKPTNPHDILAATKRGK